MVAILGIIIPAPLAIPIMVTSWLPMSTVRQAVLDTVSVVMIALATCSKLSGDKPATSSGMAFSMAFTFSCSPITPVDESCTISSVIPRPEAAHAPAVMAARMPASPVQALAQPLLIKMACALPCLSRSISSTTGAAFTWLVVKAPAVTAGTSLKIRPRSSRSAYLIPAATAAVLNPLTFIFIVILFHLKKILILQKNNINVQLAYFLVPYRLFSCFFSRK